MSNYHRQVSRKSARTLGQSRQYINYLARSIALVGLITSGSPLWLLPGIAAPTAPNVTIDNQATGSFTDLDDPSKGTLTVVSNNVSITVAEVAGVTVTTNGVTGTPNPGSTIYYSFVITNVGNDPTQFFIPSSANLSVNTTQPSNIEITGYNLNGTTPVSIATPIVVPTGGGQTGHNGTVAGLLTANGGGIIQPGGSVTVRVPVKVNSNATNNDTITVQLGDTPVDPASTATPQARLENQAFIVGNNDVYTVDNPDSLETSVGMPINGDATGHRQEASATQSVNVKTAPTNFTGLVGTPTACTINTVATSELAALPDGSTKFIFSNAGNGGRNLTIEKTSGIDSVGGSSAPLYKLNLPGIVSGIWLGSDDNYPAKFASTGLDQETYEISFDNNVTQSQLTFAAINFNGDGDERLEIIRIEDASGTDVTASTTFAFVDGTPTGFGSLQFNSSNGRIEGSSYQPGQANGTYGNSNGKITIDRNAGFRKIVFKRIEIDNVDSSKTQPARNRTNGVTLGPISYCTPSVQSVSISGTVFEDPNYGGGAGRPLNTATTSPRNGATVELYQLDGTYITSTTTSGGGKYTFTGVAAGDYKVRVVNSTVTSSRSGYVAGLLPVQTFRTDATTGTVTDVTDYVGGEKPQEVDAPANTSANLSSLDTPTQEVQSITTVKVGSSNITGIDFGYNFDTIVNTNDSGQGSLRQFLTNAATLGGEASLAQAGNRKDATNSNQPLPAGKETSIFMIPDGSAHPGLRAGVTSGLIGGVAIITPATALTEITGTNAIDTSVDGTTQTVNVGDTNSGLQGVGGSVGTGADGVVGTGDEPILSKVYKPEVQIVGNNAIATGMYVNAKGTQIRGLAIYGFGKYEYEGNIFVGFGLPSNILIEQNYLGSTATSFSKPANITEGSNITTGTYSSSSGTIQNNLIGYAGKFGVWGVNSGPWIVQNNEIRGNAILGPSLDGVSFQTGSSNNLVQGNLIIAQAGNGVDAYTASGSVGPVWIRDNTITGNGVGNATQVQESAGIRLYGTKNEVSHNLIYQNYGAAVMVVNTSTENLISQNSIYGNGTIPSFTGGAATKQIGIDLLAATDGNPGMGVDPYVSANDGAVITTSGNQGMDYPVITTATLSGGTLKIGGFIGNAAGGSATFANAKIEVFIAENAPTQNLGNVIVGDGLSKQHGEGKTYIGSCTADAQGLFTTANCSFTNAGALGLTDATNITATATDSAGNTSEFSAQPLPPAMSISGTVFEDSNYGGGVGRNLATPTTSPRDGATVELYKSDGTYVSSTTTSGGGKYTFTVAAVGDYKVRVVNSTVTSSRTGYVAGLLPVQTFRTDATTGTVTDVTDYVGGEKPDEVDAAANTGSQTIAALNAGSQEIQSITAVKVGSSGVTGIDFGYNFDTIVNPNDLGQGSLRQFIINANTLKGNAALAQVGLTAGKETSIFMISNGTAAPGLRATNNYTATVGTATQVATIKPKTALPDIIDSVVLDGYTQPSAAVNTLPVGNNAAIKIEVDGSDPGLTNFADGIHVFTGASASTVRGLSVINWPDTGILIDNISNGIVEGNFVGLRADGSTIAGNARSSAVPGTLRIGIYSIQSANTIIGGPNPASRNIVSGNQGPYAIHIGYPTASDNIVQNNYVGLDATGTVVKANANYGIAISAGAPNAKVLGNVGAGHPAADILVNSNGANTVTIQGNYSGMNAAGNTLLGAPYQGISVLQSSLVLVGGPNPADRNYSVGAGGYSIALDKVQNSTIQNNVTGFFPNGTASSTNIGLLIYGDSQNNQVKGNTFSNATTAGVYLREGPSNNTLDSNFIGTDGTGAGNYGNSGYGIYVGFNDNAAGVTKNNTISSNIIANTKGSGPGIGVNGAQGAFGNTFTKNSLYANGGLGIDLQGKVGVSANDGLVATGAGSANTNIDYPVITSSTLTGGTLKVSGYVGNNSAGSATFANAKLEFFIADNTPANQNGEVILGDNRSKPHGEGRTYIGGNTSGNLCVTDANGLFNCSFSNAGTLGLTDPKNITATATDTAGNTSEFSAIPSNKANVLLVKRITAIKDGVSGTVTPYNTFVDDTTSTTKTNDNNCGWPGAIGTGGVCTKNTYTVGATSETALKVKPGDEIEYTIYYLNAGENKANQVRICDQLDSNLTFKGDPLATPPTTTAPLNIQLFPGSGSSESLTNALGDDKGELTTPVLAGTSCNLTNNTAANPSNNVVVVDVAKVDAVTPANSTTLSGSTGVGIPTTSYGYIRFKTTVK